MIAKPGTKAALQDEIADLKARLEVQAQEIADVKKEAEDLEKVQDEALRLLGVSPMFDLVETIKELRDDLGIDDGDKESLSRVVGKLQSEASDAEDWQEQAEKNEEKVIEMDVALTAALEDREKLLRLLDLGDREWSSMGGACSAHLEV